VTLVVVETVPQVERLTLAVVRAVPEWHPEPFPVHAWIVRHPAGVVLVDTGIGTGNDLIGAWYRPLVTPLVDALGSLGLDPGDITAVVLSHLHFDHCGQQGALAAPVYVQRAEHDAAQMPRYPVPEWAAIPAERLRLVDGDAEIMDGLRLVSTPGHTPGHQSVVIEAANERVVLATQCAYRASELRTGQASRTNVHDDARQAVAGQSLDRIRSLAPATIHLSHDPETVVLR
jgi:N-acyl homoserine lactone hydrolase